MRRYSYLVCIVIWMAGCRKPYNPPAIKAPASYLVVEGAINNGADSTVIKLSRTVNLLSNVVTNPVVGAMLTVEGDDNSVYPLTETARGHYMSPGINLDGTRKYRLRIKTSNDEYLSDFIPVLNSPPIDSISYAIRNNGINIYSGTHDPTNNTHYYRWDYQETWVIHSNYYSFYKSNGDSVIARDMVNDQVYQCWQSDTSGVIILASSANLRNDVIVNNPVTFIDPATGKLSGKNSIIIGQAAASANAYSILLKQYALTGDAYTFWANLKTNTEQLGSIFDAQPSSVSGNIHSINNPAEVVIGYISAGTVASKRIFITNAQIPNTMSVTVNPECQLDSFYYSYTPSGYFLPLNQEDQYFNYNSGTLYGGVKYVPIAAIFNKIGAIIGHTGSTEPCVDCTLRGTNKQPAFWR